MIFDFIDRHTKEIFRLLLSSGLVMMAMLILLGADDRKVELHAVDPPTTTITERLKPMPSSIVEPTVTLPPTTSTTAVPYDTIPSEVENVTVPPTTVPPTTAAPTTVTTPPTTAAPKVAGSVWDSLAQCETGGNWSHPPVAGGFSGGIMFHIDTWVAMGGAKYASQPYLATKAQQIAVAEDLLAEVGSFQPWPGCRKKLGLY